ncbi:ty3-gypsy retrotransposon protein [Tanacetum coccineum]
MTKSVREFVRACDTCQRYKSSTLSPAGLLQPLPIPDRIWEDISIDFIIGLPKSKGYKVILVVVDHLLKYCHFIPLKRPFTARSLAEVFLKEVIRLHRIPKSVLSDRDPLFLSMFWKEIFSLQGSKLKFSSAYHPETNGQTEVVNRSLETYLRCFAAEQPINWSFWLPWAEFWHNTSFYVSTNTTPFEVVYGRALPTILKYVPGEIHYKVVASDLQDRDEALKQLKYHLARAQEHMKKSADKHRREVEFAIRDWQGTIEDATWEDAYVIQNQFPNFRLEDKPVSYEADIDKENDNIEPLDIPAGPGTWKVYKRKKFKKGKIKSKATIKGSGQGITEFKNETELIAKLQHTSLVRLLGCCIEKQEKILVYEYMPNNSLDFFLFDPSKKGLLGWTDRFVIIEGIAQGLLYLHKFSGLMVIHRDLKASNILLDSYLNPKISDLAWQSYLIEMSLKQIQVELLEHEYMMNGAVSTKTDVFSFGVLLLEIVSSKMNHGSYDVEHPLNLQGLVKNKEQ